MSMRKSMPIIPVKQLKHLIDGVDKLEKENKFSVQTVKTLIYEFSNEYSILSVEIKNDEKPLWLKALDSVVPPASSKLHVQPEEENVTTTFASKPKVKRVVEKSTPKKKQASPRRNIDDVFSGIDDEILGE